MVNIVEAKKKQKVFWTPTEGTTLAAEVQSRLNNGKKLSVQLLNVSQRAVFRPSRQRVLKSVSCVGEWLLPMLDLNPTSTKEIFPRPKVATVPAVEKSPPEHDFIRSMVSEAIGGMITREMVQEIVSSKVLELTGMTMAAKPTYVVNTDKPVRPTKSGRNVKPMSYVSIVGMAGNAEAREVEAVYGRDLVRVYSDAPVFAAMLSRCMDTTGSTLLMGSGATPAMKKVVDKWFHGTVIPFPGTLKAATAALDELVQ
jgi:hypothetical protein